MSYFQILFIQICFLAMTKWHNWYETWRNSRLMIVIPVSWWNYLFYYLWVLWVHHKKIVIFDYDKLHTLYWDTFEYCHFLIIKDVFIQALDMDQCATIYFVWFYCENYIRCSCIFFSTVKFNHKKRLRNEIESQKKKIPWTSHI